MAEIQKDPRMPTSPDGRTALIDRRPRRHPWLDLLPGPLVL